MPGVPLDLDLPVDTDTVAVAIPKLVEALQTIQTDIEAKVLPAEMDMLSALDMAGNDVTGVGLLQMEEQSDLTGLPADTVLFFGGELYAVTTDGPVQLTLNGGLDASGIGGIGGDYSTSNALVYFSNASAAYRFYADFGAGTWADVEGRDLILHGALAKYTITLSDVAPADKTLTILAGLIPGSGAGLATVDSSGNLSNSATVPITNEIEFQADINLTAGAVITHGNRVKTFLPFAIGSAGGVPTLQAEYVQMANEDYTFCPEFNVGDRVKSISFDAYGDNFGDIVLTAYMYLENGGTRTTMGTLTQNNVPTGYATYALDFTDTAVTGGDAVVFQLTVNNFVAPLRLTPFQITYDRP